VAGTDAGIGAEAGELCRMASGLADRSPPGVASRVGPSGPPELEVVDCWAAAVG
jgi:hypothetical protein